MKNTCARACTYIHTHILPNL